MAYWSSSKYPGCHNVVFPAERWYAVETETSSETSNNIMTYVQQRPDCVTAVGPVLSRQSMLWGNPPPPPLDHRVPYQLRAAAIPVTMWLL